MRFLVASCALLLSTAACPSVEAPSPDVVVQDVGSCMLDSDCDGGFCRFGMCVDVECGDKFDCDPTQICVDDRCISPPAQCRGPADCPGNQLCDGVSDTCFSIDGSEGEGEGEDEGELVLDGLVLNDDDVASHVTELPNGLRLQRGQSVVIARHADRALFVSTWGPLATALFVDADVSNFGVPIVNGDERFVLSKGDAVLDGPAAAGSVHHCYQRSGADASAASSWEEVAIADGTPGSAARVAGRGGLTITEWCDADTPALEFIELTLL